MALHSDICIGLREYSRTLEHVPGGSLHQRVSFLILGLLDHGRPYWLLSSSTHLPAKGWGS